MEKFKQTTQSYKKPFYIAITKFLHTYYIQETDLIELEQVIKDVFDCQIDPVVDIILVDVVNGSSVSVAEQVAREVADRYNKENKCPPDVLKDWIESFGLELTGE